MKQSGTAMTNAVRLLGQKGIVFTTCAYPVNGEALDAVSVARLVGADPDRVFKTLVTVSDTGEHYVFCVPGSAALDLKKAARAAGVRRITMLPLRELQPLTGYIHGGCSPIGMKRPLPTWVDETAELFEMILVSAGARGLQLEIAPADLMALIGAGQADLTV